MIACTVSNSLRKKLMGTGNIFFYHGSERWQWRPGTKTDLQEKGNLGYLQIIQNELANLLEAYLEHMSRTALRIFEQERFFSVHYKKTLKIRKGDEGDYPFVVRETKSGTLWSDEPIRSNFFHGLTKRGKVISGTFGNRSGHAMYVEWGTGPIGRENIQNISRAMRERRGLPKYRSTGWKYYNPIVDHVIATRGMPPRPFVYPAFLRLRSSFVNDCKAVLRGLHKAYFLQSSAVEASFIESGED